MSMSSSSNTMNVSFVPLVIDAVSVPDFNGVIGMTVCPGKKDDTGWPECLMHRDLDEDLRAISSWGAVALVSLIEKFEFEFFQVLDLPKKAEQWGLEWIHLPLPHLSLPTAAFHEQWLQKGGRIRQLLREGRKVVIHCNEGMGRTGMIAARLLVELGVPHDKAIELTRKARAGAISTVKQEQYVLSCIVARP